MSGTAVILAGGAYERGRQNGGAAGPGERALIESRCAEAGQLASGAEVGDFLAGLRGHVEATCPEMLDEIRGIADAVGTRPADLFAAWHLAVLREVFGAASQDDGCTVLALSGPGGVRLAKNRDVPAATLPLQRVFRQSAPGWRGGAILSLSSIGSSPAASSGINEAGLALADTQVATRDHGIGLLRYPLMQRVLEACRDVAEALALIGRTAHLGGGTLTLADAGGAIATVELGHRVLASTSKRSGTLCRTNHFTCGDLAPDNLEAAASPPGRNSRERLDRISGWARREGPAAGAGALAALLSSHDHPALCRHAEEPGGASTIALAIYAPPQRRLELHAGHPCLADLLEYAFTH